MRHRWIATFILVVLGSCTTVSSSVVRGGVAPPRLDDPCALLSRREVATATGSHVTKVAHGQSMVAGEKSDCLYTSDGPYGAIVVNLNRFGEQEFIGRLSDQAQHGYPNVEAVSGLGDQAYLYGGTALFILSAGIELEVGTQYYQPDGPAVLRRLAQIALTRL